MSPGRGSDGTSRSREEGIGLVHPPSKNARLSPIGPITGAARRTYSQASNHSASAVLAIVAATDKSAALCFWDTNKACEL